MIISTIGLSLVETICYYITCFCCDEMFDYLDSDDDILMIN